MSSLYTEEHEEEFSVKRTKLDSDSSDVLGFSLQATPPSLEEQKQQDNYSLVSQRIMVC